MNGVVALYCWDRQCYHRILLDHDPTLEDLIRCRKVGDTILFVNLCGFAMLYGSFLGHTHWAIRHVPSRETVFISSSRQVRVKKMRQLEKVQWI